MANRLLITTLTLILSISFVLAGNGTANFTTGRNINITNLTGDFLFSNNSLSITGNINTSGFIISSHSLRNCTTIKGNFIIKKMSTGTERNVSGILDNAIQMTSYEGDFYKYPEFNITKSYVSYARMIASETFLNKSKCSKIYLGTRIEKERIKRRFWFDKIITTYNPIVSYICSEELKEVEYCK